MFDPKMRIALAMATAMMCVPGMAALAQSGAAGAGAVGAQDPAVAVVDGTEIFLSDVEIAYSELPAQIRQMPIQRVFEPLLMQLIDRRLVAAAAEADSLDQDPFVQRRLAHTREIVLRQAYVSRIIEPKLTEENIRARYRRDVAGNPAEEEVRARHILVPDESKAQELSGEAKGGADFEALARDNSVGPSAPSGGDLGFFKRGEMVPEFADAAFKLAPGDISAPVKTQYGWHVIKVEERRSAPVPSFEEVAGDLREQMAREAVGEAVAALRDKAQIQTFNATGQPVISPPGIRPVE